MTTRSIALAAVLMLPLTGAAWAQTGTTESPGAGPSAGGTVNSGSSSTSGPSTGSVGGTGMQTAPGGTGMQSGSGGTMTRENGAGPSAGGTVDPGSSPAK